MKTCYKIQHCFILAIFSFVLFSFTLLAGNVNNITLPNGREPLNEQNNYDITEDDFVRKEPGFVQVFSGKNLTRLTKSTAGTTVFDSITYTYEGANYQLFTTYEDDGKLTALKYMVFDTISGVWRNNSEVIQSWDSNFNIISYTSKIWNPDSAKIIYNNHESRSYSPKNELLSRTTQKWNMAEKKWDYNYRYTYSYDGNSNRLSSLYEKWDEAEDKWQNDKYYSYTFSEANDMLSNKRQNWNSSSSTWENYNLYTYSYDSNSNTLSKLYQKWDDSQWLNSTVYNYTYDGNNNKTYYLYKKWDKSEKLWVNYEQRNITYDGFDNILLAVKERFDSGDWYDYSRNTYNHDANGNQLFYQNDKYDKSEKKWIAQNRNSKSYDSNNNVLNTFSENWNKTDNKWENSYQDFYTYNGAGYLIHCNAEGWNGSAWIAGNMGLLASDDYNTLFLIGLDINLYYKQITSIGGGNNNLTNNYSLNQNYPNPFNPSTVIKYELAAAGKIKLDIYNALGQKVQTLVNKNQSSGKHSAVFNGAGLASGIYFYKLSTDKFTKVKKMVLVR